jgi:2-polyprenyl-3-methyl-5-hydroxy-6-metoxy-1,4-benzoquinol methylase
MLAQVAKLHLLESGLEVDYQKIPVEDFAKDNAQAFDIVTCLEMLEHVPDPSSIIKACSALVFARFDELVPVMSALWQEFEDVFCANNGK